LVRLCLGVEPSYESISQIGTPLYNGQKACFQCVRCSEAPLYFSFYCGMLPATTFNTTGMWSSPATTGERPPPCAAFSLTSIDYRRTVMFGGYNPEQGWINDVYLADLQSMVCELADDYWYDIKCIL